ncbi:putative leucine-rich repeat-containing protein DDB_G0290503 isoform X2 [Palaemon carinicauda]|uniref:putative leucine-rich repeat-containing protein DDB_G0290503 isoform X2 n=1 Tax=Palaemon carinicauda TaxID=392227 RepID=UPI0035B5A416
MTKWATILCGLKLLLLTTTVVGNDFTCKTAGVFKKPGSCNEYYKCITVQDTFFMGVLRCQGSDLFDENLRDCVPEHTLTSPAECRSSRSRKVSSGHSVVISPPFEDSEVEGTTESPPVEFRGRGFTKYRESGVTEEDESPPVESRGRSFTKYREGGVTEEDESPPVESRGRSFTKYREGGVAEEDESPPVESRGRGFTKYREGGFTEEDESPPVESRGRGFTKYREGGVSEEDESPPVESRGRGFTKYREGGFTEEDESPPVESRGRGFTECQEGGVTEEDESPTIESRDRASTKCQEGGVFEEDGILDSKQTIANRSLDARNVSKEIIPNANFLDNPQVIPSLCDQMKSAEEYFRLVASSPLLRESLEYQTKYNEIVQQYNMDIQKAHNNTYLWRRGRSIPLILKRSHKKASEYEHNFQRKFDIYKEQIEVKASETRSPDVLWRIEAQIQELTDSMRREQEVLSTTKVVALQNFLEESINSTKREIDRLQSRKNPNSEETLLGVLVNFLRYVKNDATEVERQVTQGLEKMETLLENVLFEEEDYDKLGKETSTGLKNLEEESDKITNELRSDAKLQDRLDVQWIEVGELLYQHRHNEAQVRKEIDEREKKLGDFLDKKKKLCWSGGLIGNLINISSTVEEIEVACNKILKSRRITILDVDAEDAALKELHEQMKVIQGNQAEAVKELSKIIPQRTSLSDTLPRGQRLAEIEFELYNLKFHDAYLKKLQHGVFNARRAILILQQEFQNLQVKFDSIVTKLQEMSDSANAALDGGSQVGQRLSIETELKELQMTLQNLVLENVNECSALNPGDIKT